MRAEKKKVERMLKTARGQIDGIIRMVDEDRYCIEIANQIMATQSILKRVSSEILRAHIGTCVQEALESGDEVRQSEKIGEIIEIVDKLSK